MANEVGFAYVSLIPSGQGFKARLKEQLDGPVEEAGLEEGRRFSDAFNRAARIDTSSVLGDLGRVASGNDRIRDSADGANRSTSNLLTRLSQVANIATGLSAVTAIWDRFRGGTDQASSSMQNASQQGGGLLRVIAPLAPALLGIGSVGAAVGVGLAGTFASAGAGLEIFRLAGGKAAADFKTQAGTIRAAWAQALQPVVQPVYTQALGLLHQGLAAITPVVSNVSTALQGVERQLSVTLASPAVTQGFKAFGAQTQQAIGSLGPLLANIVPAALNLFQAMNPLMGLIEHFVSGIGPQLPALANSLTGPFQSLTTLLQQLGPTVGSVLGGLGHIVGNLLSAIAPLVPVVLQLVDAFVKIIVGSDVFFFLQQVAQMIGTLLHAAGPLIAVIGQVANILLDALAGALGSVVQALVPVITLLAHSLGPVLVPIANLVAAVAQVIGTTLAGSIRVFLPIFQQLAPVAAQFTSALASALIPVLNQLGPLINDLTPLTFVFPAVLTSLTSLLPALEQMLPAIAQLLGPVATLAGLFASRIATVLAQVVPVILQLATSLLSALLPAITQIAPLFGDLATAVGTVLTGAVSQLLPVLGDALLGILQALQPLLGPLATLLSTAITGAVKALAPVVTTLVHALAELLPQLVPIITNLINGLVPVIRSLTPMLPTLASVIGTVLVAAIKILVPVLQLVITVMNAIPIPILLPLLASLVDPLLGIAIVAGELGSVWHSVWSAITGALGAAWDFIKSHLDWLLLAFGPIGAAILLLKDNWSTVWGAITSVVSSAWGTIKGVFDVVSDVLTATIVTPIQTVSGIWGRVWGSITGIVQSAWNTISGIFDDIKNGAKDVINSANSVLHTGGKLNPLNWGTGTDNHPGGWAYVAEAGGPEIVSLPGGKTFVAPTKMLLDLPAGSKVFSTDKTARILSGQLDALGRSIGSSVSASAALQTGGIAAAPVSTATAAPASSSSSGVRDITVIAQTNANPYQIGQEILFQAKTGNA